MKKSILFFLTATFISSVLGAIFLTPFAYAAGVAIAVVIWNGLKSLTFEKTSKVIPWLMLAIALPFLYSLVLGRQDLNWSAVILILLAAFFEEIGWRGFLFKTLEKVGWIKMNFIIGLLWAAWHLPAIFTHNYLMTSPLVLSLPFFFINVILLSFIFGWFRQKTGGLWASILLHTSHNFFVNTVSESQWSLTFVLLVIIGILQAWRKPFII